MEEKAWSHNEADCSHAPRRALPLACHSFAAACGQTGRKEQTRRGRFPVQAEVGEGRGSNACFSAK
jgi:hypothetical protein